LQAGERARAVEQSGHKGERGVERGPEVGVARSMFGAVLGLRSFGRVGF
jgi:hypothetical protein